jgi:hypothetical protein
MHFRIFIFEKSLFKAAEFFFHYDRGMFHLQNRRKRSQLSIVIFSCGGLTDGFSQVRPPRDVVGDFFPWLLVQASR